MYQAGSLDDLWHVIGVASARNLRTAAAVLGVAASVLEATAYVLEEVPGHHRMTGVATW